MTITVKRSFGVGGYRYRYELMRNGTALTRLLSDEEFLYAVVNENEQSMLLRRTVSDISNSEMADPQTRIVTINSVTP